MIRPFYASVDRFWTLETALDRDGISGRSACRQKSPSRFTVHPGTALVTPRPVYHASTSRSPAGFERALEALRGFNVFCLACRLRSPLSGNTCVRGFHERASRCEAPQGPSAAGRESQRRKTSCTIGLGDFQGLYCPMRITSQQHGNSSRRLDIRSTTT